MPAAARARALAARPRFAVSLASPADDDAMAALLAAGTLPGDVRISIERSPSPTGAGVIDGDVHQAIVARDRRTGALAGMACRSVRDAYLNGSVARVGYLGQLRVAGGGPRLRALLDEGWTFCRSLHEAGDAFVYLTSVVRRADRSSVRRVESRLLGLSRLAPAFSPLTPLTTFVLPASAGDGRHDGGPMPGPSYESLPRPPSDIRLERGTLPRIPAIAACLQRNLSRYQLAPHWTAADLLSDRTRGLAPQDFVVAVRAGDASQVVGCLARWDQTAFRQVRVRSYSARLRLGRPIVNLLSAWLGIPRLPAPGQPLRFAYLSHAAVDDDRPDVFAALVAEQRRRAAAAGLDHVVAAFAPGHPFHDTTARGGRHLRYDTELALASWPDGEPIVRALDGRVPQPEVALL